MASHGGNAVGSGNLFVGRALSSAVTGVIGGEAPLADTFGLFLVQVVIILSICRVLGLLGSYLKLPKVIFEIVGGILLGPSAIGRNKAYLNAIFPPSSLPLLGVVANLGLVLYLFIVGMELDPKLIMTHYRKAGGVAFMGMAVPFALGIAVSKIMFDTLQGSDPVFKNVSFTSFYVFIGTAMSITAFPVLARILKEGALIYTKPGAMAMGAAALNDAAAWCLLILAISIANAGNMSIAGLVFLSVVAFGAGLIFLVRPLFWRLVTYVEAQHSVALNNSLFCLTLIFVFLSSYTTAILGVHSIFGAFLFGLIMPRDSHLFTECNDKIEELILTLTLPLYFALSGLQTDVTQINTPAQGAMVVLVCFVATAGKYVGAGGAAYFSGSSIRESWVIAFLMNTRGLVELIVLNLGVTAGVLNVKTFSVMVIMCLFTTFITGPMVECIYPPHMRTGDRSDEESNLISTVSDIERGDDMPDAFQGVLVREARLTVLVDRIEHLQGMMELLSCFIPNTETAALKVVAIKAFEPTMTDNDEFIGLNMEGRLIHVEAESTSYHENYARFVSANMAGKIEPQQLLPLSMYLKAVGGEVQAYRIRGDPAEFPREIRSLSAQGGSTLMLFPWRPSQYVERLFWCTKKVFSSHIALVAHLNVSLTSTLADGLAAATVTGRDRSSSAAGASSWRRNVGGDKSYVPAKLGRTDTPTRVRSGSSSEDNGYSPPSCRIKSVLVVVTGALADVALFPLALRFAERICVEVKVVVTSDRRTYPAPVREALAQFQRVADGVPNILVEHLITPAADVAALTAACSTRPNGEQYDLIVVGHAVAYTDAPEGGGSLDVSPEPEPSTPPPTFRATRSNTVSEAISPSVPDNAEAKRQLGLPEAVASSQLPYPELGVLGCAVEENGLTTYLVVVHEPGAGLQRRGSTRFLVDTPFEGGVSSSGVLSGEARSPRATATRQLASIPEPIQEGDVEIDTSAEATSRKYE